MEASSPVRWRPDDGLWSLRVGLSSSSLLVPPGTPGPSTPNFQNFLQGFHSLKGRGSAKALCCTQARAELGLLLLCEHPSLWLWWGHKEIPPNCVNPGLIPSTSFAPRSVRYIFTFNPYCNPWNGCYSHLHFISEEIKGEEGHVIHSRSFTYS